jgi:hypothetical protein
MEEAALDRKQEWIKVLVENLDAQLDEKRRVALMEPCGRACARSGPVNTMAKPNIGNIDKFLETLRRAIGKDNVRKEGNTVFLTYSKCYCPVVASGPARLGNTYCNCSRGWVLEMFETVLRKRVAVELKGSIKRGDSSCKFVVHV